MFNKAQGFTLIELAVVMAMVAILAAIAYPAYQNYVTRATRGEARADVLNIAQLEERWYSNQNEYRVMPPATSLAWTGTDGWKNFSGPDVMHRKYDISVVLLDDGYVVTATPVENFKDIECGVLSINNQQMRQATGTRGADDCWMQ